MLTGSIPGDHLSHFIVESNDNVDAAGLKNTFAIDVPAVHATAVKLTGLGFYDRIKHLIGEPADKHQLVDRPVAEVGLSEHVGRGVR